MLLVVEDKDDPTGLIAVEIDDAGGVELAYIPVIAVQLGCDERQAKLKCALERMGFEHRKRLAEKAPSPPMPEKLVALYKKALCHIGERPAYVSPSAFKELETETEVHMKFYSQG